MFGRDKNTTNRSLQGDLTPLEQAQWEKDVARRSGGKGQTLARRATARHKRQETADAAAEQKRMRDEARAKRGLGPGGGGSPRGGAGSPLGGGGSPRGGGGSPLGGGGRTKPRASGGSPLGGGSPRGGSGSPLGGGGSSRGGGGSPLGGGKSSGRSSGSRLGGKRIY
jgi:hypothetical protein